MNCLICDQVSVLAEDDNGDVIVLPYCLECMARIARLRSRVERCEISDWPSLERRWFAPYQPPRSHAQMMRGVK
jgi:hypothetical protein